MNDILTLYQMVNYFIGHNNVYHNTSYNTDTVFTKTIFILLPLYFKKIKNNEITVDDIRTNNNFYFKSVSHFSPKKSKNI